jgi:hypothetical protein
MNLASNPERILPLSSGSTKTVTSRAPRLLSEIRSTPGLVMGNRAFMRAWAARRAAKKHDPAVQERTGFVAEAVRLSPRDETLTRSATPNQPEGTSGSIF